MGEHRKELRKKFLAFTPVYDSDQKILLGFVGDLTISGVMVIGEKAVDSGVERLLKIEFPTDLPHVTSTHIIIRARTAWCRQDGESKHSYNIGFEFIELDPEHSKLIQAILGRYCFRDNYPAPSED